MSGSRVRKAQVGAALAALAWVACRAPVPAGCPERFAPDEARTARLSGLLRADPEARDLLPAKGLAGVCYSEGGEGLVAPGAVLLLPSKERDEALAARAAHLLLHVREGLVREIEAPGCDAEKLGHIRAAEERAWALEGRVRGRLGMPAQPSEVDRIMGEYEARCADPTSR